MKNILNKDVVHKAGNYYNGSVQKLFNVKDRSDVLISEITSGGSVFDVGTIFSIPGSEIGRASFRHLVFKALNSPQTWEHLENKISNLDFFAKDKESIEISNEIFSDYKEKGGKTHHLGMIDQETGNIYDKNFPPNPSNMVLIRKYDIIKPSLHRFKNLFFYDYNDYHHVNGYVIPLEYIVRFGLTSGSSILRRYSNLSDNERSKYLRELGITQPFKEWQKFHNPIIDFTTKFEPEDRNISLQEASIMSGCTGVDFKRSMIIALLGSHIVKSIFSDLGLYLWDLKWEMAKHNNDFVFVDTIDTDSVRATVNIKYKGRIYYVNFNKQAMRDYYKIIHPLWYEGINQAKKASLNTGKPFTEILKKGQEQGEFPQTPEVDKKFIDIQVEKFLLIQEYIYERNKPQHFIEKAKEIAITEIEYYQSTSKKDLYNKLNSVAI